MYLFFFFQAEDGIRDIGVTGVQTCALPIFLRLEMAISMCSVSPRAAVRSARWPKGCLPLCQSLPQILASVGQISRELPRHFRSEERRVGKECRSRWSPYH